MKSRAETLSEKIRKDRQNRVQPARTPGRRKRIWKCEILSVRNKLGLTLRDVELATGISNITISQVERGGGLSLTTARTLAGFFGMTVEQLWPARIGKPDTLVDE